MSTPDPRDRDALVAAILRATADLAAARVAYAQGVAERHGLAATDVEVLRLLATEGAMPVGRVGELTALTTGATTRLIDRLEQAGFVRRLPDPADRRRVIVEAAADRATAVAAGVRSRRRGGDARPRRARRRRRSRASTRTWPPASPRSGRHLSRTSRRGRPHGRRGVGRARRSPRRKPAGSCSSPAAPNVTIAALAGPGRRALPRPVQGCRPVRPRPRRDDHDPVPALRLVRLAGTRRGRVGQRVSPLEARPDRAAPQRAAAVGDRAARRRHAARGPTCGRSTVSSFEIAGGAGSMSLRLGLPAGRVPIVLGGGAGEITVVRPAGVAIRLRVRGSYRSRDARRGRGLEPGRDRDARRRRCTRPVRHRDRRRREHGYRPGRRPLAGGGRAGFFRLRAGVSRQTINAKEKGEVRPEPARCLPARQAVRPQDRGDLPRRPLARHNRIGDP